jgi:hypothetical protein
MFDGLRTTCILPDGPNSHAQTTPLRAFSKEQFNAQSTRLATPIHPCQELGSGFEHDLVKMTCVIDGLFLRVRNFFSGGGIGH